MNNIDKIIYLKYSELTLKGKNRSDFIKTLYKNVLFAIKEFNVKIKHFFDYMIIENIYDNDFDSLIEIIKQVPGFQYLTIAYKLPKSIDDINKFILSKKDFFENKSTFKIESKRQDKSFEKNSNEIKNIVGGFILKNIANIKVDVKKPDVVINIEVKNDFIFLFLEKINCSCGLPVGSSGRILVLLSGGIDSPVASKLLLNRGADLLFLTFITPPHTSDKSLEKIKMLFNMITLKNKLNKNSKLLICNYTKCMYELNHISDESYKINLMRRSFIRIANEICKKYNCSAIATGESLGQVASQTIESLYTINNESKFIILRPLIGFDKNTIISYSKKFNFYETSILNFPDSCSLFAPKKPVTKPKLEVSKNLEQNVLLLPDLEKKAVENIKEFKNE